MSVEQIKIRLKDCIAKRQLEEVFRLLREVYLRPESAVYNDTTLIEAQYSKHQSDVALGLIKFDDIAWQMANINKRLTDLVDSIAEGDLKADAKNKQYKFHPNHQHTCDRAAQFSQFEALLDDGENARIHYFYLHGGESHKHQSLFRRFVNRTKGEEKPTGYQVVDISIPDIAPDFDLNRLALEFSKAVLRELGNPESNWPKLPDRSLTWGITNGDQTHKLGKNGKILFHLSITDAHWDPELVPQQTIQFILNFCEKINLPADGPEVFFFFSIEYDNDNTSINKEIEKAMSGADHLKNMGELQMVTRKDIENWFKKYRQKWADDEDREKALLDHFGTETEAQYMKTVERKLGKIIKDINESDNNEKR